MGELFSVVTQLITSVFYYVPSEVYVIYCMSLFFKDFYFF